MRDEVAIAWLMLAEPHGMSIQTTTPRCSRPVRLQKEECSCALPAVQLCTFTLPATSTFASACTPVYGSGVVLTGAGVDACLYRYSTSNLLRAPF